MSSHKALVVDDSVSTRMIVAAMLKQLCPDWEIVQAKDANDAIAKVESLHIDSMLLDLNMPDVDGFELAEILSLKFPDAHIALLTANIQERVRERASEKGLQFLAKPITEGKLEGFVAAAKES